jgi:ABC-2 type transport system permease protein
VDAADRREPADHRHDQRVRSLALGDPSLAGFSGSTGHWVVLSLLWSAGLVLVFAPLAVAHYRRS